MRNLLLVLLCLPMIGLGQNVYIPDANFKSFLISSWSGVNTNGDSEIQISEANAFTGILNVGMLNISDLTGIEAFINLTDFSCYGNQLTNIDLSQNISLTYLNCQDNQLTSLDLSQNSALDILYCENNLLISLNLNGATALGAVWADNNQLTSLDLSTNISLEVLEVNLNKLTSLDVSQNPVLNRLECEGQNWLGGQLTSLDLSQNPNLQYVNCGINQLAFLNLNGAVSLENLYCHENQLTSLDLSTNTNLFSLSCSYNQLASLDITQNTNLNSLHCYDNELISLDLRNGFNAGISTLICTGNSNLTCINVDDSAWVYTNWIASPIQPPPAQIDPQHYFSNNCPLAPASLCDSFEVTDVMIDNFNLTIGIGVYNGLNSFLNYPYVAFTLDSSGDTIQEGNISLFGAINLDTTWYNYSILNPVNPIYPLNIYFVYYDASMLEDTCILTYNLTPTASTDINQSGYRKLISIVDVLGRENKGTKNELLFYIYDDGKVEKKIILE